ncbi:TPA: hypothetical protein L9Y51_000477 [Klebsiella pneumoniae]|uniref:hypothetical protein n=1 Tax=Klebsiella pneumoniae TaxID=573 RepID=UPI0014194A8D|nr:hypothetical protein [Klebsiella pneumoniae]NIA83367.1 hypothetical protein [Klebsiella pneumoniae]CAE7679017.1 hypothetical protein AI2779V1_3645 [Klebsiella pneumoniae]CAE7771814.1 hypothetical protein AI2793V1_3747 [Klebsiella pneumoniae]CAH3839663.1 hypothetical protein AI2793V1_3747 [Klebsiella pneumoniae]CAH3890415.1 hypothetical protein AI2779V1_3645 [Klebsiella pneumoniae]
MLQNKIKEAFCASISRNPKGYQYLHTHDFVRTLQDRGVHFSGREANAWIERYQNCFADKTPDHTENRLWILRNMGRVM